MTFQRLQDLEDSQVKKKGIRFTKMIYDLRKPFRSKMASVDET